MTTAVQSEASPDADSSTFGLPGGASDSSPGPVLCESHRNGPSCSMDGPVGVGTPEREKVEGRGLYRLACGILWGGLGLLLDSRRLVEAASLLLL